VIVILPLDIKDVRVADPKIRKRRTDPSSQRAYIIGAAVAQTQSCSFLRFPRASSSPYVTRRQARP